MGEREFEQKVLVKAVDQALRKQGREGIELRLNTPGGRFQLT
jgi:ClpP class serine protease